MSKKVKAALKSINIPTYKLGKPEVNPVFFEKRVYQGSSGKVYPVPFIDKVFDTKSDQAYNSAILENDFVKLVMLPEIGGRIFEAQDKTNNDYNFFYQQKVIKPALVGLAGPWISGGVEFNWPQHHRPGTYLPTDVHIEEEEDGARTIWMSEYDPINRLKGMHGIRLRPDSSLIELRGRLFNRTPLTQTFLWWANVAVEVHDNYESFFPEDVNYVADHAVRAMSSFPNAENDYYGIPYHKRKGKNDLRKYANIPVPTSYMVCDTEFNFFGGYDHNTKGGFVHVANRHIAPGKKQWTWGNDTFGKAWDKELTDEGGPYFELMAGVYTDNQPDFAYLLPYETKTFSQFWWSYKNLGPVQNANKDVAIRLKVNKDFSLDLGIAGSKKFEGLTLVLQFGSEKKSFENISITPDAPWQDNTLRIDVSHAENISAVVFDHTGSVLISYEIKELSKEKNRKVAFEPKQPNEVKSANELELIGEHLELYRHPTRYPEPYWEAAIEKDAYSYKSHIALGRSYIKKGQFSLAEKYLKQAIEIISTYHPNPASGESHYFCGLACTYQNKLDEAYTYFYKATWNYEWRGSAYYQLGLLDCKKHNFDEALAHIEASLDTNRQNNKAQIVKAIVQSKLGKPNEAEQILAELAKTDALDQWANFQLGLFRNDLSNFIKSSRNDAQTIIDIAFDYAEGGFYDETIQLIKTHYEYPVAETAVPNPMGHSSMVQYIWSWLYSQKGEDAMATEKLIKATSQNDNYFFPSRIYEQIVLEWAMKQTMDASLAAYGLGNYYFNLKRHQDAIKIWEVAAQNNCTNATLYRNLGIAYWNSIHDGERAREAFVKAIELAPSDMRIQYEYDQLRKKMNDSPSDRLKGLEKIKKQLVQRDDFCVELASLYNFEGKYDQVIALLNSRNFHPWEGGEGQVLKQYSNACWHKGIEELSKANAQKALTYFKMSLDTPDNLGEKIHPLQAKAHINYLKGIALLDLGREDEAIRCFEASANEEGDFIDMAVSAYSELSYYSALSLRKLKQEAQCIEMLNNMKHYGLNKLKEEACIDYFATSLPLLLVFEDNLQLGNTVDAMFLIALSEYGLGNKKEACKLSKEILSLNAAHVGAKDLINELKQK
ncbi:DUF5107 domain-containing protein [Seonamhaeicola maritimus]|uniref:DUF5107 domain-containing protein n=1 Tax=Seonamhaeicola maritimus TaxID=2591822 RepID=A0A5C7GMP1_9FLAO|nr:DUF5107 domain-containing protein [Seonamhaeicola maritimus]TXG39540.1 DUF5107 domain-containing protein [Seonamhaeicola maritimus]